MLDMVNPEQKSLQASLNASCPVRPIPLSAQSPVEIKPVDLSLTP
jgi:hypothetical protein